MPLLEYVTKFKERLILACDIARDNLKIAKVKMKSQFDVIAESRDFKPGELVLAFLPIHRNPLQSKFHGSFEMKSKVNFCNYVIKTPGRRKAERLVHINLLMKYIARDQTVCVIQGSPDEPEPEATSGISEIPIYYEVKISNSDILANPSVKLQHLSSNQVEDVMQLLSGYPQLFSDVSRQCSLVQHDILLQPNTHPVKQAPYRVGPAKKEILKKEVEFLLSNELLEPSDSEWASPCLLVPKPDGSSQRCTDYRNVNQVTIPDYFPLPRIDDVIDDLGATKI
ncbi:hypothetical protein Pcinc_005938 [Petrolisthes cinctipes]|uniref:Uncharacterized protein n=1 Tax=Petrolisthes cinctipes TaxID=88211 RepID=A0AAE1KZL9_PETCI|nr:hypothetical protein Pcinc_005938 [Petrolisthes cinctipes]